MGIVPIWGFQLIIAIATSIYLKLNKGLVILAANISLPPLIPFILFLSHYIGGFWFGDKAVTLSFDRELSLEYFGESFFQYVAGAITLAIVAGFTVGLISYVVLKVLRKGR